MGRPPIVALLALVACRAAPVLEVPLAVEGLPAAAPPPGEAHAALVALAGEWDVTVEAPGDAAPRGTGTAHLAPLLGGRFLRLEVALELDGRALSLSGHLGYDPAAREWQALWLSDLSSRMSLLRGRGDLTRGVHLRGEQGGLSGRSVLRVSSADAFSLETWAAGPDGRERLLRTSTYLRR